MCMEGGGSNSQSLVLQHLGSEADLTAELHSTYQMYKPVFYFKSVAGGY